MKPEHFRVYSTVKQALDQDFSIKGKNLIPLIRSVEVLTRRFASPSGANKQNQAITGINGTELVLKLLANQKLRQAMEVFNSDEGRQLINLYKSSINGNQQNLACSKWRVGEIEFAARKLDQDERLARVFANIHKNFVERSAKKCLKSSCSSVDDNMNRLDSILRKSSRRKGFLVHSLPFETTGGNSSGTSEESSTNSISEEALIAQIVDEPASEFQAEELELCRFFKRTNATNCQASGNELSEISFVKSSKQTINETSSNAEPSRPSSNLDEYLADYQANRKRELARDGNGATEVLAQCGSIKPNLDYHLFGLRWYQRQGLISEEKLRARTFWCPSLTYWFELDRLCNELKLSLNDGQSKNDQSFAY